MDFFKKYLKYKDKYITLKNQSGGGWRGPPILSTRIVIMNEDGDILSCRNGFNYYDSVTKDPSTKKGKDTLGLVGQPTNKKTLQELIATLKKYSITNPSCDLEKMFASELKETVEYLATDHSATPKPPPAPVLAASVGLAGAAGGVGTGCVPAPTTNSGRTCVSSCIHDGPVENWFRQKLLPYLDPNKIYIVIDEIKLKIFQIPAFPKPVVLCGGKLEGSLRPVENIIKETCEELFYHIPPAEHNIDPTTREPYILGDTDVPKCNTLYTLDISGNERIYFYKVTNAQGISIRDNARANLIKSEVYDVEFRNCNAFPYLRKYTNLCKSILCSAPVAPSGGTTSGP
jgi:hypothetical protein